MNAQNEEKTPSNLIMETSSKILLIVLFIAWVMPGLIGRDLWKADEPYSFGLVNHIVQTGDWVVPTLAGEPFMEKPPLFYITAATFVHSFSPPFQPHDAARLASAFYMILTLIFMGLAARELLGRGYGWITAAILIGCLGLQETAHKLITDVALLTGFAVAIYGLALSSRRYVLGGFWIGTGTGIGFMSKGLLAPGLIGITALLLPILFTTWRRKDYVRSLLIALAAALPWLLIWPIALYHRSPTLFWDWFWFENVGRFVGFGNVGRRFSSTFYLVMLPWFAFPALPLALWTLWLKRRTWYSESAIQLPLVAFLVMLTVLSLSSSMRDLYAFPMLLPVTLLAAAGADSFGERAVKVLNKFSVAFFGFLSVLIWFGWVALVTSHPASAAEKLHYLQPGYVPSFNGLLFAIALIFTLAWLFAASRLSRTREFPAVSWAAGITLVLGLLMTIWLPWFDAGAGYRPLFTPLKSALPPRHGFIASVGLGESERAMLEYYAGIITKRAEATDIGDCDFLLIESGDTLVNPPKGKEWGLLWETRRMKDHDHPKETYRLYRRIDAKGALIPPS